MGLVKKHPVTKFAIRRLHYGERGGVGNFFGTLPLDNILKKTFINKSKLSKKKYFSMNSLFKYYVSILGGDGGSRLMLILLI